MAMFIGRIRRGQLQEDAKHTSAEEEKGRPNKRWLDNIRDVMKEYKMIEAMACVWHMKTKAGPLLNGVGL